MANEKRNTNGIKRAAALGISSALAFSLWGTALAAPPLKDVGTSYAANEINTLVEKGIISGYEDGSFSPLGNLTRAELAKIITAATGLAEDSSASGKFQDVEPGSWYSGYVGALAKAGITDGTSETTFSPSANVTREQMTVFLLRAVNLEKNALNGEYASPFEDKSDISAWAAKQVGYAYQIGLYTGFTGKPLTNLEPQKAIKRQDAVKLAYEALKYAGKDKPGQPGQPGAIGSLELKSATAVIGGENYTAEHNGNGAFVISLPKGIDPEAKLTGFQLKASPDAASLTVDFMGESRTVEFKEGVALITVKDLLGGLDVNGDGVSMEKLGSVLGYSALNIIGELADKDGKTSEVKLVIKLSEK